MSKELLLAPAIVCFLLLLAARAYASDVDAAIVFAVDASGSVDEATAEQQRVGHAEALVSPEVLAAFSGGASGCLAVTYFEWSSFGRARMVLPWTRLCSAADADAASAAILARPQGTGGRIVGQTSLSFAIDASVALLDALPDRAGRTVIDIVANGENNDGPPVAASRLKAIAAGHTINALVMAPTVRGIPTDLTRYFAEQVIGGPGAFVIAPSRKEDFARALRRKLSDEIALAVGKGGRAGSVETAPDQDARFRTASLVRPAL